MSGTEILTYAEPVALNCPRSDIDDYASRLAIELDFAPGGDLISLVRRLGGRVHFVDGWREFDGTKDGSIIIKGLRDFDIYLSRAVGHRRVRFTIAHELGHYALHYVMSGEHSLSMKAERYGTGQTEAEANWFASAFLMPREQFCSYFNKYNGSKAALALQFDVSMLAIGYRIHYIKPTLNELANEST